MSKRLVTYQKRTASALLGLGVLCASALAAEPVEIEISGEASGVVGVSDDVLRADGNAEIEAKASTFLDNGIEIGAVVGARVDGDQPGQLYGGGRYSSLLIGGPRGIAPLDSDAYLQSAYAYARGAFGQVIVGRGEGVARRLAVTSPTIFQSVNVNDWQTDLSGLNDVHTVNDVTGSATKFSYLPPANFLGGAVGGLQLGVSYSPTLRSCGDSLCLPAGDLVIAPSGELLSEGSVWEDAIEAALYYQKPVRLGDDRLLLGIGASYVAASEAAQVALPIYDDYEAYSIGLNLAYRGITVGGSIKSTNAGLANADDDGYLAFDAGLTFLTGEDSGDWGFMVGYGQSEANAYGPNPLDPQLFRDTQTAQAGVTYVVGRGVTIGAAAQYVESKRPLAGGEAEEATTFVLESSIEF